VIKLTIFTWWLIKYGLETHRLALKELFWACKQSPLKKKTTSFNLQTSISNHTELLSCFYCCHGCFSWSSDPRLEPLDFNLPLKRNCSRDIQL